MKKQLLTMVLSAVFMLSCTAVFASCGTTDEAVVDTFAGAVSAESYDSAENAAIAFLENEVSGNTVQAEFVSFEIKSELSAKAVEALALSDAEKSGLAKAEEVVITYRVAASSVAALSEVSEDSYTQRVYLLSYTDGAFRYFVPVLENGENLTRSYFEDVLDVKKYLNVTYEFKSTWYRDEEWKNWDATAKINENGLYEQDKRVDNDGDTEYDEFYMGIFDGFDVEVWLLEDGSWRVSSEVADEEAKQELNENLSESAGYVLRRWLGASIDYTYFVKTDSGFALRSDKFREFLTAMQEENEFGMEGDTFADVSVEYSVFVSEGKIEKLTYMYDVFEPIRGIRYKGSYQIDCKDYGTTEITLPDEVKAQLTA